MRRFLVPLILTALQSINASSQTTLDSLKGVWDDETKADTARINALNIYARQAYMFSLPDSTYFLAGLGYQLAKSRGLRPQMAATLNTQGFSRYVLGEYDEALELYAESLQISEKIGDRKNSGAVLNNIGMIHMARGENEAAIDHYSRSLAIQKALGNKHAMAVIINNMGIIHMDMGDHEKAIQGYTQCLKIAEELGNVTMTLNALNNIGNVYQDQKDFPVALEYYERSLSAAEENGDSLGCAQALNNMGIILRTLDKNDRAANCYTRSLSIYMSVGEKRGIATLLGNLGTIHRDRGNLEQALNFFSKGLALGVEMGDKRGMSAALGNIGQIHHDRGDHVKAIAYHTESLALAQEAEEPRGIRDAAKSLFESYKVVGQYTKALEMHELYIAMRDSIMSEDNQRATIRTEFSREAERRESEIALLNAENERKEAEALAERNKRYLTLMGSGSLILLLAGGGAWLTVARRQAHRREIELAEHRRNLIENDFLRSKLKTHFVKNAMQSIDGFVERGRSDLAHEYIGRFNTLMRWILETAGQDTVTLAEELEMLGHYLALEQPSAEQGLKWEVTVQDGIDIEDVMLPPLILQPFVENALFHGLRNTGRQGEVHVRVERVDGRLVCSVEDNGRGISEGMAGRPGSNGLKLVYERLALFSGLSGREASMSVRPTGTGTRAEIRLAA